MILDFILIIFGLVCIYRAKHINTMLICSIWILVRKGISFKVQKKQERDYLVFACIGTRSFEFQDSQLCPRHDDKLEHLHSGGKKISILDCNEDLSPNILLWWVGTDWPPDTHPAALSLPRWKRPCMEKPVGLDRGRNSLRVTVRQNRFDLERSCVGILKRSEL